MVQRRRACERRFNLVALCSYSHRLPRRASAPPLAVQALELSSRIGSSSSAPQTLELSDLLYYACLLPLTFPMLCACKVAIWIGLKSYRCN